MSNRSDKVTMSHHEFKYLMRNFSIMAVETKNKRLAAKCAQMCLEQVAADIISGDEDKDLCYPSDYDYLQIAKNCLS